MSFLTCKCLSSARSVLPNLRKSLFPGRGFERLYWRRRGDAFSELSSAMQSMENYMKEVDREMNRFIGASPLKLTRILSPFDSGKTREVPVISTGGDGRTYRLQLDMQGMEPEDINITLKDGELTITARRDEKRDDGSRYVSENAYHYTLPAEVNPEAVRSSLADGVLTIEAPLPALESKEIPVKIESGQKGGSDSSSGK